jgi:hypothetical protein
MHLGYITHNPIFNKLLTADGHWSALMDAETVSVSADQRPSAFISG